tara:strand:- start:3274 stop:4209 length:936 start_codon:yes stop_codon:yes gene_type:complete
MTRVAIIGYKDSALCGMRISNAINSVIENSAISMVMKKHRFDYPGQCVGGLSCIINATKEFLEGSTNPWVIMLEGIEKKNKLIYNELHDALSGFRFGRLYVGSEFRDNPKDFLNMHRDQNTELCIVSPDSMHLIDSSARFYPYLHTVSRLGSSRPSETTLPIKICHSPSSLASKGTNVIWKIIMSQKKYFSLNFKIIHGVPYSECLRQREGSHIFVGQINKQVGGFGYSSVEAMAQGMVSMVTRNHAPDKIWEDAGLEPPPVIDFSERSLKELLSNIDKIQELREKSYDYVNYGQMSQSAAGSYYLSILSK